MPFSVPSFIASRARLTPPGGDRRLSAIVSSGVPPTAQGISPTVIEGSESAMALAKLIPRPTPAKAGLSWWIGSTHGAHRSFRGEFEKPQFRDRRRAIEAAASRHVRLADEQIEMQFLPRRQGLGGGLLVAEFVMVAVAEGTVHDHIQARAGRDDFARPDILLTEGRDEKWPSRRPDIGRDRGR